VGLTNDLIINSSPAVVLTSR